MAEVERVAKQREELGPEGMKEAGREIKEALSKQVKAPTSMVSAVPMAEVDTIAYQTLLHYNYTTHHQPPAQFDLKGIPYRSSTVHSHEDSAIEYLACM